MAIQPVFCTLTEGKTQQFTLPNASGPVTWSIQPQGAGMIAGDGLYVEPAAIPLPSQVTVTATAGGVTENAIVNLAPPEVILTPPGQVALTSGQVQQFTATVPGDDANNVAWTWSPSVGDLVNG